MTQCVLSPNGSAVPEIQGDLCAISHIYQSQPFKLLPILVPIRLEDTWKCTRQYETDIQDVLWGEVCALGPTVRAISVTKLQTGAGALRISRAVFYKPCINYSEVFQAVSKSQDIIASRNPWYNPGGHGRMGHNMAAMGSNSGVSISDTHK